MRRWLPLLALLLAGAPPPPVPDDAGRIVGGVPAKPDDAPWQVEIRYAGGYTGPSATQTDAQRRHDCGGALIAADWVLTAGHCLVEVRGIPFQQNYVVRAGSLRIDGDGMKVWRIDRVEPHPRFARLGGQPSRNDFMLLHIVPDAKTAALKTAVRVRPIVLVAPGASVPADAAVVVSGWGFTHGAGGGLPRGAELTTIPADLHIVNLVLVPLAQCQIALGLGALIPATQICAGRDPEATIPGDSCGGDSGGPLVWTDPDASGDPRRLLGLVGWGPDACDGSRPGVYNWVGGADIRNWIAAVLATTGDHL